MWEINTSSQIITFIYSLGFGLVTGIFFDIARSIRPLVRRKKVFIFVTDLLFWIMCALALFCFLLERTNGELRGFVLFGASIGFLVERFIISPLAVKIFKKTFQLILNLFKKIFTLKNKILDNILRFFISIIEKFAIILKKPSKRAKKP